MAHRAVNEVLYRSAPAAHLGIVQFVESNHDGGHLRLRLGDGDAGLEASDDVVAGVVSVGPLVRRKGQRDPDLRGFVLRFAVGNIREMRILEALRYDADDLVVLAVEQ